MDGIVAFSHDDSLPTVDDPQDALPVYADEARSNEFSHRSQSNIPAHVRLAADVLCPKPAISDSQLARFAISQGPHRHVQVSRVLSEFEFVAPPQHGSRRVDYEGLGLLRPLRCHALLENGIGAGDHELTRF